MLARSTEYRVTPEPVKPFEVVEAGERILSGSGARIAHDQADRAFYNRQSDSIHLRPKDAFKDPAAYYGSAMLRDEPCVLLIDEVNKVDQAFEAMLL